ncbi:MAG TPA: WYL domain-containing protein, partial [Casimicrobiaceae bacterium]|nr:WYL domain-containing protein [Casimicrobiaceae bacterium]
AFRTYRVGRMSEVEALDEPYDRPRNFDLAAWWTKSSREYEMSSYRGTATIRLSPRGLALVHMLGPYVAHAVAETVGKPDDRGWVRCAIPIESVEYGVSELMRLGSDVEVVGPPALRARMAQTLSETLEHYAHQRSLRAMAALDARRESRRPSRRRSR